jgi:hypothetical protein
LIKKKADKYQPKGFFEHGNEILVNGKVNLLVNRYGAMPRLLAICIHHPKSIQNLNRIHLKNKPKQINITYAAATW